MRGLLGLVALALLAGAPVQAKGLLGASESARDFAIEITGGRIFLPAVIAGQGGAVMFDTGTADALFLNRDALALAPGRVVGGGRTASGQMIEVQAHPAPPVHLAARALSLSAELRSGNFGFVQQELRPDFLGFAGAALVSGLIFEIDAEARRLSVWRPGFVPALAEAALRWQPFVPDQGALPVLGGRVADAPIRVELDTGDGGTLYLRAETAADWRARGLLTEDAAAGPDRVRLPALALGEVPVSGFALRLVVAGGPQDHRAPAPDTVLPDTALPDTVRLGAGFIAACKALWDMAEGRLGLGVCRDGA